MADTTASLISTPASPAAAELPVKSRSYWATVAGRVRRDPVTLACGGILAAIFLAAIFAPWIVEADLYKSSMLPRLQAVFYPRYFFGTAGLGRGNFALMSYGAQMSAIIGLSS